MMGVATYMMKENGYTNQIRSRDLDDAVGRLWDKFPRHLSPYGDAAEGEPLRPLRERLAQNPNARETIQRDVRVGGVFVQDLSGRDVFSYAHKSYMEYLVSSFFASYLLQNDYDRQSLMMSNAIAEALGFRQSHLQTSPDVESFASELISGQVEVKDRKGNVLPIQGNEDKYSKMIYKILMPNIIARWIPNLYGYSTLHPSQRYCIWSLVGLEILGTIYYFYLDTISNIWLYLGSVTLYMAWFIIIFYFKLLKDEKINIHPSTYLQICGIYIFSCNELKLPQYKIDKSISALIQLALRHV